MIACRTNLVRGLVGIGFVFWLGQAEAVVVSSFSVVQDCSADAGNSNCCILATAIPQDTPSDVFGTPVTMSGDSFCLQQNVAGVVVSFHCDSVPAGALSFDITGGASVCADAPTCSLLSAVGQLDNVTGTIPDLVAAGLSPGQTVTYTTDSTMSSTYEPHGGASPIDGCPTLGPGYGRFLGQGAFNAFLGQPTPAGTDVTSTASTTFFNPITQEDVPISVGITFDSVTAPGSTTVTALSNHAGSVTANFAIAANGFQASFLEISTTASFSGNITICTQYDDVDNDGFIDGTTVPETALSLLHGEGDPVVFVDSTSSQDVVANEICALVNSLSPFVAAVRLDAVAACGAAPREDCRSAAKSQLAITHDAANAAKDALKFMWSNGPATLQSDLGNPAANTETALCVFDETGRVLQAVVPAAATCGTPAVPCWAAIKTTGYKFKDKVGANNGVTAISIKGNSTEPKSKVQVKAKGTTMPDLASALTGTVTVQLTNNSPDGACFGATYSGDQILENSATKFQAKAP